MSEEITRKEQYLAKLGGKDITLPEPITRKEKFLANAAGMTGEVPEPITREEMYLSQISGGGGGYPEPTGTIEITENGTFDVKDYATAEVNVASAGSFFNVEVTGVNDGEDRSPNMYTFMYVGLLRSNNAVIAVINQVPRIMSDGQTVQTKGAFIVENYGLIDIANAKASFWENYIPSEYDPYYEFVRVNTETNTLYLNLHMTFY